MTDKMQKMTPKQRAFADCYIKSGNAAEAAREAGYSKKTARSMGEQNLKKPHIQDYIGVRIKEIEDARIASAKEILQYFTAVMRGEVKDQFGFDAPLMERTRAAVELAKRIIDRTDSGRNKDGQLLAIIEAVKAIE